jgi:hypothetical protein
MPMTTRRKVALAVFGVFVTTALASLCSVASGCRGSRLGKRSDEC